VLNFAHPKLIIPVLISSFQQLVVTSTVLYRILEGGGLHCI